MFPRAENEPERLAAVDALQIIGSRPDPIIDRICSLASEMFSVPISVVSVIGRDEQWFKAKVGIDLAGTSRDVAFCNHTILSDDLLVVPEALNDPRFSENPLVTGDLGVRFYAGAPLALDPGLRVGTLCLIDRKPRVFTAQEQRQLRDLADILVGQIELHRARIVSEERAEALVVGRETLQLAADATGLGTWDLAGPDSMPDLSASARAILGFGESEPVDRRSILDCVHKDDRHGVRTLLLRATMEGERSIHADFRVVRPSDGAERWIAMNGRSFERGSGARRVIGTVQDVTERNRKARALADREERLHQALHAGRTVAWERDVSSGWVVRSDNSIDVLGIGSGTFSDFLERIHPDDRAAMEPRDTDWSAVEVRYRPPGRDVIWLSARGATRLDEFGRERVVGLTSDITARKAAEAEIWRVANHDSLTGLPNRKLFLHCLDRAIADVDGLGRNGSLVLIDLDDFKDVNDTLGHEAGDHVLSRTAAVLREHLQAGETVARLGGDEFAITLLSPGGIEGAAGRTRDILDALRTPFWYEGHCLERRASAGIATFPVHDRRSSELMKDADIALYRAKSEGRDTVVVYRPEFRASREAAFLLAQEIRDALANDLIVPFYQPKICLRTGKAAGFEALARWRHPDRGVLTPGVFGAVFDDPQIARAIGVRMMREVVRDIRTWRDRGIACGRIAVNFSSAEFHLSGLADRILATLESAGVGPESLEVEVTESVFLGRRSDEVLAELQRLHQAGVTVALDDFGTGFASLTHLKQFPVDNVKIDRSFISGLTLDRGDEAIVAAVIGLGRSLNVQVTAEGIETEAQAAFLVRHGCDFAQGYLYGRPMGALQVPAFVKGLAPKRKTQRLRGAA